MGDVLTSTVSAAELILERDHLAVDPGAAAVIADLRVDGIREIDGRGALHQLLHRALGGKDVDHVRVEVQLDGLHELPVVRDILVGFQELTQPREDALLRLVDLALFLVRPVRRNPFLGDPVHLVGPDLKLHVLALGADHGRVQRLVMVGLRHADVVLEATRDRPPQRMDKAHNGIAVHLGVGDHPDGGQVVDLVEGDGLMLHLLVDGVEVFGPAGQLADQPVLGQLGLDDGDDLLDVLLALLDALGHPLGQPCVDVGLQCLEAEVLELGPHPADPEPVGQGGVDIERFLGHRLLVGLAQVLQGAHVVQAVRELDQDDPDVVRHRDQHLAEVLGLLLLVVLEGDLADLGDAVHEAGDVLPELRLDLLPRADRVFHRVVQQPGHDG